MRRLPGWSFWCELLRRERPGRMLPELHEFWSETQNAAPLSFAGPHEQGLERQMKQ